MKRAIIIQHESCEVVGTLDPLLKKEGIRLRYVNFVRHPDANPSLEGYDGLILLGGYMGVYEHEQYAHLKTEMRLIEEALRRNLPVLGICLGAQILAHVLGAHVRPHVEREMGWYDVSLTKAGRADPVLGHFRETEKVFQSHGDTFDVPATAVHLAGSRLCEAQAFRYGTNAYGFQFHIEVDRKTIGMWLDMPENQAIFAASPGKFVPEKILEETSAHLPRSISLSEELFRRFLQVGGAKPRPLIARSGHGKPTKPET